VKVFLLFSITLTFS